MTGFLRVLRPGGRLLFNVLGQREGTVQHEASLAVGQALGRDPATLLAPPYNDVQVVETDLTVAGFGAVGCAGRTPQFFGVGP